MAFNSFSRLQRVMMGTALLVAAAPPAWAQGIVLPEGLTIQLQTRQDISSKSAKVGDQVELAVAKPVTISGVTIIPEGATAIGEVTRVRDNGLLGRSGKLDISVSKVQAGQVEVPVRGAQSAKGKSGTLGAVGAGIVFLPLAAIVRGKDVKLPAGTTFEVYVDREVAISSGAPAADTIEAAPAATEPAPSTIRTIDPNEHVAS